MTDTQKLIRALKCAVQFDSCDMDCEDCEFKQGKFDIPYFDGLDKSDKILATLLLTAAANELEHYENGASVLRKEVARLNKKLSDECDNCECELRTRNEELEQDTGALRVENNRLICALIEARKAAVHNVKSSLPESLLHLASQP